MVSFAELANPFGNLELAKRRLEEAEKILSEAIREDNDEKLEEAQLRLLHARLLIDYVAKFALFLGSLKKRK